MAGKSLLAGENMTGDELGAKPRVAIIGAGVVGSTIGILLHRKGYPIQAVTSRTREHAAALAQKVGASVFDEADASAQGGDVVFITTPDREIENVARKVSQKRGFRPGQLVLHTSGFLSSEILKPARDLGARTASLHPLQSFADVEAALARLPGSFAAIEGGDEALALTRDLAADLGLRPFVIPTSAKPLYHAAAAIASNYLVSLVHFSLKLYESLGLSGEEAMTALLPLVEGTLGNIRQLGPTRALTGPISRGDFDVVKGHLEALSRSRTSPQPEQAPGDRRDVQGGKRVSEEALLYAILGKYTIRVARERGSLGEDGARRLEGLFTEYIKHCGGEPYAEQ